jgi:hypothetical protein
MERGMSVPHLGGEQARPAAVALAEPFDGALVPIGTEHSGALRLDQLLQAVASQPGISSPAVLQSSNDGRPEAPESILGMVRLVEVVHKPGKKKEEKCRFNTARDILQASAGLGIG